MKFLSLAPFVPSGGNFEGSKQLFQELGFTMTWDVGDYVALMERAAGSYCSGMTTKHSPRTL